MQFKISVIGSNDWGTTVSKILAENATSHPHLFKPNIDMWVSEEKVDGRMLTDIINQDHENVRYLPGVKLPGNLRANSDIVDVAQDADLLVFNLPHQLVGKIKKDLMGKLKPKCRAISCINGLEITSSGCKLLSTYITKELGIACGALSETNVASEIARKKWSETTVAYILPHDYAGPGHDIDHDVLKAAFHRSYFHVNVINDVAGVSVAGALKNIVALAAGFVEGLGWGENAKAAVIRVGLVETIKFSQIFFPESHSSTFTQESAGVTDLIAACSGGHNVKVGRHMAITGDNAVTSEKTLVNGQSCEGFIIAKNIHDLLNSIEKTEEFPLFEAIYQIIYGSESMESLPVLLQP